MSKLLFNLYYSSTHNYNSKTRYFIILFQIVKLTHIIIILDIIFSRSNLKEKNIHFPLYFFSPIFYLEHFLTKSNKKCLILPIENNISNDQLQIIISFIFNKNKTQNYFLCNFDSYIIYISSMIILISILLIVILIIPVSSNKIFECIGKFIYSFIYIFYVYFLHILFYLSTRKFIFHSTIIKYKVDGNTCIWIFLTILLVFGSLLFNKFTKFGNCFLNYMIEDNTYETFLSLLAALNINLRFAQRKLVFFHFWWYVFYFKQCYCLLKRFRYGLLSNITEKIDFYIYFFFLSYSFVQVIITCFFYLCDFIVTDYKELVFHVIEFVLGIVMFCLFLIIAHNLLRKDATIQDLVYSLHNGNKWGTFEYILIKFICKFVDYFEFRLLKGTNFKDKELMLEIQKRKKKIISAFKNKFLLNINKHKTNQLEIIEIDNKDFIDNNNNNSEIIFPHNKNISTKGRDEDYNFPITDEMILIYKFNFSLKKLIGVGKNNANKLIYKKESISNKEYFKEISDFKTIISIILNLRKLLKQHINSTFWNDNEKAKLYEFLIFIKLICFYIFDETSNRAEFYVKKYLEMKHFSSKFSILIRFLDIKFRKFSLVTENSMVHILQMLEYTDQLLDLIKMFRLILEQLDLNGDTEQKRIEIIENSNKAIGICYCKILNFAQFNENQFKRVENSTNVKLKIAKQLLFHKEIPEKIIEETDIQLADIEFQRSNFFILLFEKNNIIIRRAPAIYLQKAGYNGVDLYNKEYINIIPKCFRAYAFKNLRNKLLKKGKYNFEQFEFLLTKNNYIIRSKLNFNALPIICNDPLVFAEIDFNVKNLDTCFIINSKKQIIEISLCFKNYFGLNPSMLPLSISDIFDTNQPLCNKFLHNKQYNTLKLQNNTTVSLNLGRYLEIYQTLQQMSSIQTDKMKFIENIKKILDLNKIKDKSKITILFSKINYSNKYINNLYDIYSFSFINPSEKDEIVKLTGTLSKIDMKEHKNINNNGDASNESSVMNDINEEALGMKLENRYTYCSTVSVSMSNASLNKTNFIFGKQFDTNSKNKKNANIPELLEIIYGGVLITVIIILVIFIRILSDDLLSKFSILKSIRNLTSIYYNGAFHLINKIRFNNNENYNKLELQIIQTIPNTKPFTPYYQEEFELIANNFFKQYNEFISEIHEHLSNKFINNYIKLKVKITQNDGSIINKDFLEALDIPKLNFYYLSRNTEYTESLPFFNIKGNIRNELYKLTEIQRIFYVTLINYKNILDSFLTVSNNIRAMFLVQFNSYELKIYLIFCCSVFLSLMSFFLYVFNINLTKRKIIQLSKTFFLINHKKIVYLNQKLDYITKIIEVEEQPSQLLKKLTKSIQKSKIERTELKKENSLIKNTKIAPKNVKNSLVQLDQKKTGTKNTHNLQIYYKVLQMITLSHCLFLVYGIIVLPIISKMMNNILIIQFFTKEITSAQRVSLNYYIILEIYILFNKTKDAIESGYVNNYPSSFYTNLNNIQNYIITSKDLLPIKEYIDSLNGDNLCENTYIINRNQNKINMCKGISIQSSSWTILLSHIIRTIRNLFYNFDISSRSEKDIENYLHSEEMQELNIIAFAFVQEMMNYVKDVNGMVIYEKAINNFVMKIIIMFVVLILLEVGKFIFITLNVIKKVKTTFRNFKLIEKFISS